MIDYKKGDIIKAFQNQEIDVLVHGCNCFCTMGAGIAKQLRNKYSIIYKEDCKTLKGDRYKLGTIGIVRVTEYQYIVNAYTQYTYWDKNDMLDYEAIRKCMVAIYNSFKGLRIGMPRIGCGLAGGDWSKIKQIIGTELYSEKVTVYSI